MSELNSKRKGARSAKDIPEHILESLQNGEIETANLVEWLAIDRGILLTNFLQNSDKAEYLRPVMQSISTMPKKTVNTVNEMIGSQLYLQASKNSDDDLLHLMRTSTSDVVRCWAAYAVTQERSLSFPEVLKRIEPFAADSHFGVREISWLSVRRQISDNLVEAIECLSQWSYSELENIRRFSSEATRPRGVWCAHLETLKKNPEMALPILEPLKSDTSLYVRDSVGNWLNDAAKSAPNFVTQLCEKWKGESSSKETAYIIKKATRNLI